MKKIDIMLVFIGALLISFSYGTAFFIPLFIQKIGGNEITAGCALGVFGVGTVIAVLWSKILFKKIAAKNIASIGALSYALGSGLLLWIEEVNVLLFIGPLLLGFGWGCYYNAGPYILSLISGGQNRSTLFSYLSAFTVLGSGCSPVLFEQLQGLSIDFTLIFFASMLISSLSALIFFLIEANPVSDDRGSLRHQHVFSIIIESKSIYPLLMVLLGACTASILLNFQTTLAASFNMNYSVFFAIYTFIVVVSRFTLGKYLSSFNQYYLTVALLFVMTLSLLAFQFALTNFLIYVISAALFALSYGLVYPTILALAVNLSPEKIRSDVISYFSLLYFLGLYAFPLIGGLLIIHLGYPVTLLIVAAIGAMELMLGIALCKSMSKKYFLNIIGT